MGLRLKAKTPSVYESIGMVSVNANSKALPTRNQAPQEQQQPRQAKKHSGPRDYLGLEKLVRRHSRPVECRGEQDIEIEQGKWRSVSAGPFPKYGPACFFGVAGRL